MSSEKRLVLFMLVTAVVLGSYGLLNQWMAPPPRRAAEEPPTPDAPRITPREADKPGLVADVDKAADSSALPSGKQDADQTESHGTEQLPPQLAPLSSTQWLTLGSFDANSPYPLLAVFTTRGAAIERLELVERNVRGRLRYRALDDHQQGYLGYLALKDEPEGGCRIQVVPPGTPAALAESTTAGELVGLQPGDVLMEVAGTRVHSRMDVAAQLSRFRSGQKIELAVLRDGRTLRYTTQLEEQPLRLISPESPGELGPGPNPPSFRCMLDAPFVIKSAVKDLLQDPGLATAEWRVAGRDEQSVTFEWVTPNGQWLFRKKFVMAAPGSNPFEKYHLVVHFEAVNRSTSSQRISVRWHGPNGLPTEGWWYSTKVHHSFFGVAGARDLIWSISRGQRLMSASEVFRQATSDVPDRPIYTATTVDSTTPVRFVGVDTQYFAVLISHPRLKQGDRLLTTDLLPHAWGEVRALPKDRIKLTNVSFSLTMPIQQVEPGATVSQEFLIFAGPKDPLILSKYGLDDAIYYGWFPWVAKPLSALLHTFYFLVRNYGLAIILLTVLVRAAMLPLGQKAARNAATMQALAPELKRIAEQYKNDPQKRLQAQQQLYREHNFNPFGGCLLLLIQLPIFIGLYRCLAVDINLRQAALIPGISWCSNLAGPDQLWKWPLPEFLAGETGWLGPYLNVLPILTIALFLVQQKLFTPPPTDEQQRVQQQMMTFMMVFIGILFFKVPSGLCIYFIASSIWSIGERLLLPKPTTDGKREQRAKSTEDSQRRRSLMRKLMKSKRK